MAQMSDHNIHDFRSLQMHRIVGQRLRAAPALVVNQAIGNLTRWKQQGAWCSALDEWEQLLADSQATGDIGPLLAVIGGTDQRATRLRQSTPFPGIVTEAERMEILRMNPL